MIGNGLSRIEKVEIKYLYRKKVIRNKDQELGQFEIFEEKCEKLEGYEIRFLKF